MAKPRTREEWNAIIGVFAPINNISTSTVALWLALRDLAVTIAIAIETIVLMLQSDIDDSLVNKQNGNIYWWPIMLKEFQYGDSLVSDKGIVKYATIDPAKQIVTQAAVKENDNGVLYLKVAKDGAGGAKEPLSVAELAALKNYVKKRRAPGVKFNLSSRVADVVKYILTIKFDPAKDSAVVQAAVEAALDEFRDNLPFDAVFYKDALIDKLMDVDGVIAVPLQIDMSLDNATVSVMDLESEKELPAGYFNWDAASTITMQAA